MAKKTIEVGGKAPSFDMPTDGNGKVSLPSLAAGP